MAILILRTGASADNARISPSIELVALPHGEPEGTRAGGEAALKGEIPTPRRPALGPADRARVQQVIEGALAEFSVTRLRAMPPSELEKVRAELSAATLSELAPGNSRPPFQAEDRADAVAVPMEVLAPDAGGHDSHDHEHAAGDVHDPHDHSRHHHGHHDHHHGAVDFDDAKMAAAAYWAMSIQTLSAAAEFIGGSIIGSTALIADSIHIAADIGLTATPLFSRWLSHAENGRFSSLNRNKIEAAVALAGVVFIAFTGFEAAARLLAPVAVPGVWAVTLAFIGLVSNSVTALLLHPHQHRSLGIQAAFRHFWTDALGSIVIILAGALMILTRQLWIDPIADFSIIGIVFYFNRRLLRDSWKALFSSNETDS